jgi:hypothetical protein
MQSIRRMALIGLVLLTAVVTFGWSTGTAWAIPFTRTEAAISGAPGATGPSVGEPDAGSTKKIIIIRKQPPTQIEKRAPGTEKSSDIRRVIGRIWLERIFGMGF